eukprot:6350911-Pyramimonas_sp.AAC.1
MLVPKFEVHEVHGNSKYREAPLKGIVANWWARLRIVLGRLHTHCSRRNGQLQRQLLERARRDLIDDHPEQTHAIIREGLELSWSEWLAALRSVDTLPVARIASLNILSHRL